MSARDNDGSREGGFESEGQIEQRSGMYTNDRTLFILGGIREDWSVLVMALEI